MSLAGRSRPAVLLKKGGAAVEEVVSLEGPLLKVKGELVLFILLSAAADELIDCSRGISEVQGEFLKISIPGWLAGVLRIEEGDLVCVHNAGGKFHIGPLEPRRVH
jgi:hypothetical protein